MSFSDGYFEGGYISDGYCGGSMSYCSQADLVARFGLTELTQLSNRDDTSMQSMTIFGAASSVGVVSVAVGAVEASATVAVGDTAAVIAANLALALGAVANAMITVSVSGGQVFLSGSSSALGGFRQVSASALNGSNSIGGITVSVGATPNQTVLAALILDADALIDSYLNNFLPLETIPSNLVRIACVIVRFMLYGALVPDAAKTQYDEAINFLKLVSQGKLSLAPDASGTIEVQVDNTVQFGNGGSVFGRGDNW